MNSPITIKDRIFVFMHHLNMSPQTFAYRCMLSQQALSNLNENSHEGTFSKIYSAFPELSPLWLKLGKGEMLRPTSKMNVMQELKSEDYLILSQEEAKNAMKEFSEARDLVHKQMVYYTEVIAQKDNQISRLLSMIEEKDKTITKLTEIITNNNN